MNHVDKWIVLGCWQFYCCEVHNYVTVMNSQQKLKILFKEQMQIQCFLSHDKSAKVATLYRSAPIHQKSHLCPV